MRPRAQAWPVRGCSCGPAMAGGCRPACSRVHAASCACTRALQPSPSSSPALRLETVKCVLRRQLWLLLHKTLVGDRARRSLRRVAATGPPLSRTSPGPAQSHLFPTPPSSLFLSSLKASFSPFQKISDGLSEARVAGACNWWGSLLHTHALFFSLSLSFPGG